MESCVETQNTEKVNATRTFEHSRTFGLCDGAPSSINEIIKNKDVNAPMTYNNALVESHGVRIEENCVCVCVF